jgi:hypothetical protein
MRKPMNPEKSSSGIEFGANLTTEAEYCGTFGTSARYSDVMKPTLK